MKSVTRRTAVFVLSSLSAVILISAFVVFGILLPKAEAVGDTGVCGATHFSCTSGYPISETQDQYSYTWYCAVDGGITSDRCLEAASVSGVVNAKCGTTAPSCLQGTSNGTVVSSGDGSRWTCYGINGGSPDSCFEPVNSAKDGSCSTTGCAYGTITGQSTAADGSQVWQCLGTNGGQTASCSHSTPTNGQCVGAKGAINECLAGYAANMSQTSTLATWECRGYQGGTTDHCSATLSRTYNPGTPGQCGAIKYSCIPDNYLGITTVANQGENNSAYTWTCNGEIGAVQAYCSLAKSTVKADGQCATPGTPAESQCYVGYPKDFQTINGLPRWVCGGVNGGADSGLCTQQPGAVIYPGSGSSLSVYVKVPGKDPVASPATLSVIDGESRAILNWNSNALTGGCTVYRDGVVQTAPSRSSSSWTFNITTPITKTTLFSVTCGNQTSENIAFSVFPKASLPTGLTAICNASSTKVELTWKIPTSRLRSQVSAYNYPFTPLSMDACTGYSAEPKSMCQTFASGITTYTMKVVPKTKYNWWVKTTQPAVANSSSPAVQGIAFTCDGAASIDSRKYLPPGCTSVYGFSPTLGVTCEATLPVGCSSASGFSTSTGVACKWTAPSITPITPTPPTNPSGGDLTIEATNPLDNTTVANTSSGVTFTGVMRNVSSNAAVSNASTFTAEVQFDWNQTNCSAATMEAKAYTNASWNTLLGNVSTNITSFAVDPTKISGSNFATPILRPGTHCWRWFADGDNMVTESNESNNASPWRKITIGTTGSAVSTGGNTGTNGSAWNLTGSGSTGSTLLPTDMSAFYVPFLNGINPLLVNTTMKVGSEGPNVVVLQQALSLLGYLDVDKITGVFGPETKEAVAKFQCDKVVTCTIGTSDEGLGVTRATTRKVLNSETMKSGKSYAQTALSGSGSGSVPYQVFLTPFLTSINPIKVGSTLKLGDSGASVIALQQSLYMLGYLPLGKITGYFGSDTKSAVLSFQCDNGLGCATNTPSSALASTKEATRAKLNAQVLARGQELAQAMLPGSLLGINLQTVTQGVSNAPGSLAVTGSTAFLTSFTVTPPSITIYPSTPVSLFTFTWASSNTVSGDVVRIKCTNPASGSVWDLGAGSPMITTGTVTVAAPGMGVNSNFAGPNSCTAQLIRGSTVLSSKTAPFSVLTSTGTAPGTGGTGPTATGPSCSNGDYYVNGTLSMTCPKAPNGGISCEAALGGCAGDGYVWINGQKVQWRGNTAGACYANSACDLGYECGTVSRTCQLKTEYYYDGAKYMKRTWNPTLGAFDPGVFVQCTSGYAETSPGVCEYPERSCTVTGGGSGVQTYNATAKTWGTCVLSSCSTGTHLANGSCVANVQACDFDPVYPNGYGQSTWSGGLGLWGTCDLKCNTGYVLTTNNSGPMSSVKVRLPGTTQWVTQSSTASYSCDAFPRSIDLSVANRWNGSRFQLEVTASGAVNLNYCLATVTPNTGVSHTAISGPVSSGTTQGVLAYDDMNLATSGGTVTMTCMSDALYGLPPKTYTATYNKGNP